jgi:glucose/arabinose dehydrogenase
MMRFRLGHLSLPLLLAACQPPAPQQDTASIPAPRANPADARPLDTTPWQIAGPSLAMCARADVGLTLPDGFCAVVVADSLGPVRHLDVSAGGDVYASLSGRRDGPAGVIALRDADGDGRAEVRQKFENHAGSGLQIHDGWLYFAMNDGVVRWRLTPGQLVPTGQPQTVVSGLPVGGHASKSLAFDGRGNMFVNIGSATNACQQQDRTARSPGRDPCAELQTRAGIWRFDANRANQTQADAERWATGIRNGYALDFHRAAGVPFTVSHGRDQLNAHWGMTDQQNADVPAEEMFRLDRGTDGGWPYCYFDPSARRKVLAPEYGGNGTQVGRCTGKPAPAYAFPAHWAPNDLLFYTGTQFPTRYRGGAFVAFHGSWNRAPLPQQGFNVTFLPMTAAGAPSGPHSVFAQAPVPAPGQQGGARHRPTGLAQGPDGSLYVSDDAGGRIWRIMYVGER